MGVRDDVAKLPRLRNVGLALIDLVEAIAPGVEFKLKGRRWVPTQNFMTITVQSARAQTLALSLRGHPKEFPDQLQQYLPLKPGRGNGAYSDCRVHHAGQLAAAA